MLQEKLFNQIIAIHPSQTEAIQDISKVLNISKSNVYRKITGETALKPTEIELLAKYYQVSLDALMRNHKNTYTGSHFSKHGSTNLINTLEGLLKHYNYVIMLPNSLDYYYINEITWSLFSNYPTILLFKSTHWNRLSVNKQLSSKRNPIIYNPIHLTEKIRFLLKEINNTYSDENFRSIKIWDKRGFNLYFEQLHYSYENGFINRKDALDLLVDFDKAINELEQKVAHGMKDINNGGKNLEVYYSAVPIVNNWWIRYTPTQPHNTYVLSDFDPPRLMKLTEPKVVNKMLKQFHHLKKRCIKISETGEVTRRKLFNHYRGQLYKLKRKIE